MLQKNEINVIIIKKEEFQPSLSFKSYNVKNIKYLNVFKNYEKKKKITGILFRVLGCKKFKTSSTAKIVNRLKKTIKTTIPFLEEVDYTKNDLNKCNFQFNFLKNNLKVETGDDEENEDLEIEDVPIPLNCKKN